MAEIPSTWMTFEEAAERMGITPRFLRELWYSRRIGAVKIGRLVRFRPEDLDRFSAENEVRPA